MNGELVARAQDLAERWVFPGRTGIERDSLVDKATGFVKLALADLRSKEAVRLSKRFDFTLRCVLLDATRKEGNRTRLAPMSSLDDASIQPTLEEEDAKRAVAEDEARREDDARRQKLDDLEEAKRQLKARDGQAYDMLMKHAEGMSYKKIGFLFGMEPSVAETIVEGAKAFMRSVIQRLREGRGEGGDYGRVG